MITGKRKLCYTEASDFTEIQGVGNDPIYKRYNSVYSVVRQYIDEPYRSFLAEPEYSIEDDQVFWYVEDWGKSICPVRMKDLTGSELQHCQQLLDATVFHYQQVADELKGENQRILKSAIKFINEDFVYLFDNYVVLSIWGMKPDSVQHVGGGTIIHEVDLSKSHKVTFDTGEHGVLANKLEGSVRRKEGVTLSSIDLPKVNAKEGYEFIGWEPSPLGAKVEKELSFKARYKHVDNPITKPVPRVDIDDVEEVIPKMCHVRFIGNQLCTLIGVCEFDVNKGTILSTEQIPEVQVNEHALFKCWSSNVFVPIYEDKDFYAECTEQEPEYVNVEFCTNDNGTITGESTYRLPVGTILLKNQIPSVKPKSGYKFVGWDNSSLESPLTNDTIFNAVYEKKKPWWKVLWLWLTGKGCLKWLLFFSLLLLLLFLLNKCCNSCTHPLDPNDTTNGPAVIDTIDNRFHDNPGNAPGDAIGDVPSTPIDEPDLGEGIDPGNGDGDYHAGVIEQDPSITPIDNPDDPEGPQIMPNVINVFFTKDNANLNAFAKDFRDIYHDTQKYLLDYDDFVKRVSIVMPAEERISVKKKVESILGKKYDFIIVDELAIQQNKELKNAGTGGDLSNAGWHLRAVRAPQAWQHNPGDVNVTVAVVDDGFDTSHDMFKEKIVEPYNVFTKSAKLTRGSGHGTHTAGLAVGYARQDGKAAGIAPMCRLMPVQVFDGEKSTLSAEISGIAYAIHKGADVINISMGCSYEKYRSMPESEQEKISRQKGKNEEFVWRRIFSMAKEKNVIIVFSAGNDNVVSYLNPQNRPDSIISVTAVDRQLNKSIFIPSTGSGSNFGTGSTIAAPGSEIYSSIPVNSYQMMQGTSMAAPIVSGACALLKSVKRDLTAAEAIEILKKSGKTLGNRKLGPFLQVDRAVVYLKTGRLPVEDNPEEGGSNEKPGEGQGDDNSSRESKDYSDIFRQIAEHQKAIIGLIEQLPPEERSKVKR